MNTPAVNWGREPRLIVVGGFLGSGKTTSIGRLASMLRKLGRGVAIIITTAEGGESVDALRLRELGFNVEEVPGSAPAIIKTAERWQIEGAAEVVLVEMPGASACVRPNLKASGFSSAPLTLIVDATRAPRILGIEPGNRYSDEIANLYRGQIEQASLILIAKSDLIPPRKLALLRQALERPTADVAILELAARSDVGLEEWFHCLSRERDEPAQVGVDPQVSLSAEGSLAALNCAVNLSTVKYFDGDKVLLDLAVSIQDQLRQENAEIAHLKMALKPKDGSVGHASASATSNDVVPELLESLPEPIQIGRVLLNLRAEADPEVLHSAVNRALLDMVEKFPALFARLEYCEHFRPEAPAPA